MPLPTNRDCWFYEVHGTFRGTRLHVDLRAPVGPRQRSRWREVLTPAEPDALLSHPDGSGRVALRADGARIEGAAPATRPLSVLEARPPSALAALRGIAERERSPLPYTHAALAVTGPVHGEARDPYDRLCDIVCLRMAWSTLRAAGMSNAAGADGLRPHAFSMRLDGELDALACDLRDERYHPLPLRWFTLPKRDGGERRIGISALRDRVAQRAWLTVAEPWFEPHFSDRSFAFRPHRGAHHAVIAVLSALGRGLRFAARIDVRSCFDSLPHDAILSRVAGTLPSTRMVARGLELHVVRRGDQARLAGRERRLLIEAWTRRIARPIRRGRGKVVLGDAIVQQADSLRRFVTGEISSYSPLRFRW